MGSTSNNSPDKYKVRLTTETEHLLYKRFSEEKAERERLEGLVNDLQSQIDILQQQLKCLAENKPERPKPATMETSAPRIEYSTDEEDLARETEWIRTKTRKKRKLNTSPTLDETVREEKEDKEKSKKTPLPPPIIVDGVGDYQSFFDFLCENQDADAFTIKMLSGNTVKINAISDESYRSLTNALNANNCLWHSYENKQERPIRVMAKQLHSTCKPERIIEDLKNKGYKIIEATNKLSWKTKQPLNMFMLTFDNSEDINKVFNIRTVLGCKIEIQPLKTLKLVPQCKRCQAYGHTQKYCRKEPRCVKCTGKHLTKDCKKPHDEKPKCVHCGAPHPANYRGCAIAKEIQLLRNKKSKKSTTTYQPNVPLQKVEDKRNKAHLLTTTTTKNISYAQAAKGLLNPPQVHHKAVTSDTKIDDILKLMLSFDGRLKAIENSTITAKPKPKK